MSTVSLAELRRIIGEVDHFQHRVLQDALAEASADYWRRRAGQFAAVGTPRCDEIALACRAKAALIEGGALR